MNYKTQIRIANHIVCIDYLLVNRIFDYIIDESRAKFLSRLMKKLSRWVRVLNADCIDLCVSDIEHHYVRLYIMDADCNRLGIIAIGRRVFNTLAVSVSLSAGRGFVLNLSAAGNSIEKVADLRVDPYQWKSTQLRSTREKYIMDGSGREHERTREKDSHRWILMASTSVTTSFKSSATFSKQGEIEGTSVFTKKNGLVVARQFTAGRGHTEHAYFT